MRSGSQRVTDTRLPRFGTSVARDEETAIFGATDDVNADGVNVGSAFVFEPRE